MSSAVPKDTMDAFDGLAAPSGAVGNQDKANTVLTYVTPEQFDNELRRREDEDELVYIYCLVFPVGPKKQGRLDKLMKSKAQTQNEVDDSRHVILKAIRDAGFKTELVYSSTRKQIICKIGCTDSRLLQEAELKEYKLELSPKSVQHVAELRIKDIKPNAVVTKPVHPIYLGYNTYEKEDFEKIQATGGEEALPLFLYDGFDINDPEKSKISLKIAKESFKAQSSYPPFDHLHVKYEPDWERRIIDEHNVQLYRTYNDGTIMRTVDRITLLQSALLRDAVSVNGIKGAGLDFKQLKFKGTVLAYYPIQFSVQTRKAKNLTAAEIYAKFLTPVCFLGCKMFLPWRQPIQDLRDYCGEKIAYYFAFLQFYSYWLLFSSFFGAILFIAQTVSLFKNAETATLVLDPVEITKCEIDNQLNVDDEIDRCFAETFVFGNGRTPFVISVSGSEVLAINTPTELPLSIAVYALGISLWAAFFLEFWKRYQATLAYTWGVSDYERTAEVRPEFRSDYNVPGAITGLPTPYRSPLVFGVKISVSLSLIATAVVVTIAAFGATYIFKVVMAQNEFLPSTLATQVALIVNAFVIILLGTLFKTAAKKLTDWENHRTDVEYEDNLIGKTFVFSFFNSYTTLVYFAFVKSGFLLLNETQYCVADLQDIELNSPTALEDEELYLAEELLKVDSCYGSLGYSLVIIFFSQIVVNNSMELGIPLLSGFLKTYFSGKALKNRAANIAEQGMNQMKEVGKAVGEGLHGAGEEKAEEPEFYEKNKGRPVKSPAETQFLLGPYETPFQDYLELALQFGYVTLFVAAFPLAPLLALINNFIEVFVDAKKVCILSRRPNVSRAQDIGTWLNIFTIISYIAIVTNAAVLLFTSVRLVPIGSELREEQDEGRQEADKVWAFLLFILGVFAIKYATDFFISDVPAAITIQLERQKYLEQKLFYDDEDDQEKFVISVEKKKEDADEIEADLREFQILDRDPYMDTIIAEIKDKLKGSDLNAEKLFSIIDTNNSGTISLKELRKALLREDIGIGSQLDKIAVKLFVEALDLDGDGKITRDELSEFLEDEEGEANDTV